MYQLATYLPPSTNREDYLRTLSIFDDDTLQPISLSGITLANSGASFTAAAWTVIDGNIVTTSATSITIPTFPITGANNLTALALTVAAGLGIKALDPIQIQDTATGKNILNGFVTSYNINTGALIVQIGWTFQFEIRRGGPRNTGTGYITWWDWSTPDDLGPLLQANFGNGYLSLIDIGVVQILIPESVMKTLGSIGPFNATQADSPGTYRANLTGTNGVDTRQFLVALQPIADGGVTN
jgi:hypothetical protein